MKTDFYKFVKLDTLAKRMLFIAALLIVCVSSTLTAQDVYKYSGVVQDESGIPLPGVNVIEKGTSNGAITNLDGNYEVSSPNESVTLSFSMVGYVTFEQEVIPGTAIDIVLEESIVGLDEVVVVGYGTQKRSNVTGAIAKLDAEQLVEIPSATINQAIQGRMAGVNVRTNSGSPGAGSSMIIRGVATNGDAEPLYVVDGIRMNNIDFLEPFDIASVDVLKDAASAAIYGAEAANGVVLISTKRKTVEGISLKDTRITYNFQFGLSSIGDVTDPMDAASYAKYLEEANTGVEIPTNTGVDNNWMDEIGIIYHSQE